MPSPHWTETAGRWRRTRRRRQLLKYIGVLLLVIALIGIIIMGGIGYE